MADWEDVPSGKSDGWEDVTPAGKKEPLSAGELFHYLTGGARPGHEQSEVSRTLGDMAKNAFGMAEVPATLATGAAGMVAAPIGAAVKTAGDVGRGEGAHFLDNYEQLVGDTTYQPKTEAGQDMYAPIGDAINRYGIAAGAVAHAFPIPARMAPAIDAGISDRIRANLKDAETAPTNKFKEAIKKAKDTSSGWEDIPVQRELFSPDEQPKGANPYEAQAGYWTKDENGIPIRADLSMEAQNMQAPLQRNLWGDELPTRENPVGQAARLPMDRDIMGFEKMTEDPRRTMENDLGMTQALDRIPDTPFKGDARDVALDSLRGKGSTVGEGIPAPGALEAAKMEAESPFRVPKSQRGGINVDAFELHPRLKDLWHKLTTGASLTSREEAFMRQLEKEDYLGFDHPKDAIRALYEDGRGDFEVTPKLKAAATNLSSRAKRQRGVVNPEVFKDGFHKVKKIAEDTWLRATGRAGREFQVDVVKDGHVIGAVTFDKKFDVKDASGKYQEVLEAFSVGVNHEYRGKGLAAEMYKFASELGNDIRASSVQTEKGKQMWEGFDSKALTDANHPLSPEQARPISIEEAAQLQRNKYIPKRQRGVLMIDATPIPPNERPGRGQDSVHNPLTPATIAERQKARRFSRNFPVKDKALDEFDVIKTKEEAIALAKESGKDIVTDIGQKQLGSGINFQAVMSNNPILKFARTKYRDARTAADQFSKKYITNNKEGLSPLWQKMKPNERTDVIGALMEGDRELFKINDHVMNQLGFNEHQRAFVETFYKADEALYQKWSQKMSEVGLKIPERRDGHFPGIFTGAYKAVVTLDKKAVGVISVDTKAQYKLAMEHFKKEIPGAEFLEKPRGSLTGVANRYYSDIFSGMADVLEMLGKEDPRFAEVQEIVNKSIRDVNNTMFNFNVHELHKKGVVGSEGNKPWLSDTRNAHDAFKSLVRYFEEGALHHELQPVLRDMRDIAMDPELNKTMPNALKYLDAYTNHVTGRSISELGRAINTVIDLPFRLLPTVAMKDGNFKVGLGVGTGVPIRWTGATKNFMSQMFMGWGNYMFTLSQLMQPAQTGLPFMQLAADRLGLNHGHIGASLARGSTDFMRAIIEDYAGVKSDMAPHMREAYIYAKERGMLEFSEMEKAYQGTQSKVGVLKDKAAETNMKFGEWATRTPMFLSYTDLLVRAGMDVKQALPIAENLTQFSMIDYHAWERPMVYQRLGVVGQFAGGLTTFKHGYLSMQAKLGKEAVKGNPIPLVTSVAGMVLLAGITGTPFYQELNQLYGWITNTFGGEQKTIREDFLAHLPEWANSGVVSAASDLNMQGKFSSADMIPDSIAKGASPHLEAVSKILTAAYDAIKNHDSQSMRNLATSMVPSGWKGAAEATTARGPHHLQSDRPDLPRDAVVSDLIGTDGLPAVERTDKEWTKRAVTGLRPQREAVEREGTWDARKKEMADTKRRGEISKEYERAIINNTMTEAKANKLIKEYLDRKGEINDLIELETKVPQDMAKTQKQRMEGVPSTARGVNRYNYYNR